MAFHFIHGSSFFEETSIIPTLFLPVNQLVENFLYKMRTTKYRTFHHSVYKALDGIAFGTANLFDIRRISLRIK